MPSNLKKRVHARMNKTGESYVTAHRHVREQVPTLATSEHDDIQVDEWADQIAAKWLATPIMQAIEKIVKPITDVQRVMGVTESSRMMDAIRGPFSFHESDRFDHLEVFERVRQITQAMGQPPAVTRMLERQALGSIVPNRSAGRMLAWASQGSEDPHVRAFSNATWANPRVRPWRAWIGLVLRLYEEYPRLEHAARMFVENDLEDAEKCFAQVVAPKSREARAALANWLLGHMKTAS